jgi:hypothetical protein
MGKQIRWGSRSKFRPFYVQFDLLLTTTIQSLSLSDISSLLSSSCSSSISGVIAFIICLFFAFLFNTFTSAFLTTLRISFVLNTNYPLIATCFPFLCSLCTYDSSLYLAISFCKRAFSDVVLLKAAPDHLIYCFIGVLRVEEQTILLTSNLL